MWGQAIADFPDRWAVLDNALADYLDTILISEPHPGGPGTVCIMVANTECPEFSSRFSIERYVIKMGDLVKVTWVKF